ncbi:MULTISPECIES: hypothetical protein [unclassified Bradyrhizobium]|uniref:hypothetical protein n=1 Tax=unclassified Bradyrhizobium TaxID=2631580 RepID=UPI0024E174D3|nr:MULTISPECIES: hypothetical protein [unclassified Bradyrhizobium]
MEAAAALPFLPVASGYVRRAGEAQRAENGSRVMTLAGRLSMVVAYAAFAFVGAIVIGLF